MNRCSNLLLHQATTVCLLACLFGADASLAQSEPAAIAAAPTTPAPDLSALKTQIEAAAGLPEEVKARALEVYERAVQAVADGDRAMSEHAALQSRIDSAPARIAALREQLENPPAPAEIPADSNVGELQALGSQMQADFQATLDAVTKHETEKAEFVQGTNSLVETIVKKERGLRSIGEKLAAPPAANEPAVMQDAGRAYLSARKRFGEIELNSIRLRAFNTDLLIELISRERDAALARVSVFEAQLQRVDELLQSAREKIARAGRWEAALALASSADLPEPVAAVAKRNSDLKVELQDLLGQEAALNAALRDANSRLRQLRGSLTTLRERVATYGASRAIGRFLQRRLKQLPSALDYRKQARERRDAFTEVTDRRMDVDDRRQALYDIDSRVDAIVAPTKPARDAADADAIRKQAAELLKIERDTLTDLSRAYDRYMARLAALDAADKEIAGTARETTVFIRKQLIWTPTLPPISPSDFAATPAGVAWVMSPANWREAILNAGRSFLTRPLLFGGALVALIAIFAVRGLARRRLPELAAQTRRIRSDNFLYTLKAFAYTLVAASALSAVLAFFAALLESEPVPEDATFSLSAGAALWNLIIFAYLMSLLRWLTLPFGLGVRHFRWPASVCASIEANLTWLTWLLLPMIFIISVVELSADPERIVGLGRPALMVGLLGIAVFVWRTLSRSSAYGDYRKERPEDWRARLWFIWFPAALGIPVALCILSGLGYQVAAGTLMELIFAETTWLLLGLLLMNDLLIRWFNIAERKSRFEAAIRQREAAREQETDKGAGSAGIEVEVADVDYRELGEQARTVIRVGVFLGLILSVGAIWSDLVPTLALLEHVELPFSKLELVNGVEQQIPVNLADILIGILIFAGTLFAARNLPGLLEFTILRRLHLDAGGNYAIVTLYQYLIIAIGVLAAISTIGLQWAKFQWLLAALGVGLGFGLQEIVANFVSGIILLFERPVRIGDIVTVGNADGYVLRIRIRATTILTWERKELIIPNKEFITGQVINWTLSDSMTRILLNVGVAYGSDTKKALELLKEAAVENENVLADPPPRVTFESFGDNALMLYLRCFIASAEQRLETVTALHEAINEKYTRAEISIAFPQRDVHLDASKPLEIKLHRPPKAP